MTESDLRAVLGENLKRYRVNKRYSQAKLAEMLDISPNFISDIETGKRWLSSDTLINLANSLQVKPYEFLRPMEKPNDEMTSFINEYTQKATSSVFNVIKQSLDELRKQYL
ncbi:MAG: helix-turn-helix domain-containing protein [Treponema sp.]|nr:helix-turn-helix domain-containing protein [Treponema sp.]